MWVTNLNNLPATEFMNSKGNEYVETLTWVKTTKDGLRLLRRGGCTLWHSNELCLVFLKFDKNFKISTVTNFRAADNTIISPPNGKISTKPFQLYEYIEAMWKKGSGGFFEMFARPHNARY